MTRLPKVEADRVDKAKVALDVFRALQPTLTAYAQMLTGRADIRVVAAAHDNGSTDGKSIYYRPPIELGNKTVHQRRDCHKRGTEGKLLCPACEQRESVLATIYHEIAHIWFNSFDKVSDRHRSLALVESIKMYGGAYGEAVEKRIREMPPYLKDSYMALAGQVSEYLPTIVNALEDARVNRELFRALPGTKIMFDCSTIRIFAEGVEQQGADGEWTKIEWREYPLNAQIITALFCAASAYEYKDWFHPKVVESMADEKLSELVAGCDLTHSMGEVYSLSFPILARLRELGYCASEKDPIPPMPSEPDKSEDSDKEEREGDDGEGDTDGTGTADPKSDSSGSDTSGEDGSSDGGDESGESAGPTEMDDEGESSGADGDSPDGTGEVDREEAEGSSEDDPSTGGDAGGEDGRSGLGDSSGGDRDPGDRAADDSLAEDDRGAPEAGGGDGEKPAGESSPDERTGDSGSESTALDGEGDVGGTGTHLRDGDGLDHDEVESASGETAGPEDIRESESHPDDDEDGLVDTGSFDRGTRVVGEYTPPPPAPPLGDSDDVKIAVHKLGHHEEKPYSTEIAAEAKKDEAAMKIAIVQGVYFEMPSVDVYSVKEYKYPAGPGWLYSTGSRSASRWGSDGTFDPSEADLGPALLRARVVFADNQRSKYIGGLKSGKVSPRQLGKRAPVGDERLMRKKIVPGKKNYFVEMGLDISASTGGVNITLIKQVAMAEGELLSRLGIKFAVYAHSGGTSPEARSMYDLHMYVVKGPDEPWNEETKNRLRRIGPDSANLDGHTMEYYRKGLDRRPETNKILHYYSDGAMPCENHDEELAILKRELRTCKQRGYTVLGVGVRTNAPKQHGLETVRVDAPGDIRKVVDHLQKYLIQ